METKPLFTVIGAGKYKGKKLSLPSLGSTRSTKSLLKGSFFDTFQYEILDKPFVELFGGSGSMGLEALSRGAKHAYFIEKDASAFAALQKNCSSIDPKATSAFKGDTFTLLPTLLERLHEKAFLYADPPFSIREGMEDVYQKTIDMIAAIPPSLVYVIAIEHMHSLEVPKTIGAYAWLKTKRFGKSALSYYQ